MRNGEEEGMVIDSSSELFKLSDITEAIKSSNFNKDLALTTLMGIFSSLTNSYAAKFLWK